MISKKQGFSLIEVLIALLILTLGLISTVKLQVYTGQQTSLIQEQAQALSLAENKLEQLRALAQSNSSGSAGFAGIVASRYQVKEIFQLDTEVTDLSVLNLRRSLVVYAKRVKVSVSWRDRTGKEQKVEIETLFSAL